MYIHNYYGDLLLSIRVLFDKYIFENPNFIKRYEFNMGNRIFQIPIDYKPNYEFPNMIVSLSDDLPAYGQRPDVSQLIPGYNIDQIPVLYNKDTNSIIYTQEEMATVPISIIINCESQFQAKEIANVIKRWLPHNKFIQFLKFSTFLELSNEFISKIEFDVNNHDIINLYQKLNKRTGEINHCFSLNYKPFIRLESLSTSISDSTQRSYQVSADLTYMIQLPLYLYSDKLPAETIEGINFLITPSITFEPIMDYSTTDIISKTGQKIPTNQTLKRQMLISDDTSVSYSKSLLSLILTSTEVSKNSEYLYIVKGSDEYLYITLNESSSKYKIKITDITELGTQLSLDDDFYLLVSKNLIDDIKVEYFQRSKKMTILFDKTDFIITSDMTYNFISSTGSGNSNLHVLFDYKDFVLNEESNSIVFSFALTEWNSIYKPSLTKPLILQFYGDRIEIQHAFLTLNDVKIMNLKMIEHTTSSATFTWASIPLTTTCLEYGVFPSYSSFSKIIEKRTSTHRMTIFGLIPDTEYICRVNALDEKNEQVLSESITFII